jgi:AcrR family transcriptional regulator
MMDRRTRKKAATREALLNTALALFARRGIYAPSVEEITDGADLGKGTFYQYFSSRDDLIAALVARGFASLLESLGSEIPEAVNSQEALRALFRASDRFFKERPEYLLLFHQARGWLKLPGKGEAPVRKEFRDYVTRLEDFVPSRSGGKKISDQRRHRLALAIAGSISGILSFRHILGESIEGPDALFDDVVLLSTLLKERAGGSRDAQDSSPQPRSATRP